MWLWWVRMPSWDLTDVTLVSEDAFLRLDWYDSGECGCLLETWLDYFEKYIFRNTFLEIHFEKYIFRNTSSDDSHPVRTVIQSWQSSSYDCHPVMTVIQWWQSSIDDSHPVMRVIQWWQSSSDGNHPRWQASRDDIRHPADYDGESWWWWRLLIVMIMKMEYLVMKVMIVKKMMFLATFP